MGFIRRQLLKVIEWKEETTDRIVYRYEMTDRDEIMNGCQLIVTESQVAMLVSQGQIADVFGPGRHRLETNNIPILTKIAGWKYGFNSPFKADVYYVNTKQFINQTWGTTNPVMMNDAEFGPVRIRAYGKYSFKVADAPLFMREIFGTNRDYTTAALKDYFKGIIVSNFSSSLGKAKIPVLEIASQYNELGDKLLTSLADDFSAIGINLVAMYVENVSLPEEVEKAIDKRTSVGVMSDKMGSYVTYESAGAMRDAAQNPSGGIAGAGVGIGAGLSMGAMMSEALKNAKDDPRPESKTPSASKEAVVCSNCGNSMPAGSKFCPECGTKVPSARFCSECGTKLTPTAKFCPECGKKQE